MKGNRDWCYVRAPLLPGESKKYTVYMLSGYRVKEGDIVAANSPIAVLRPVINGNVDETPIGVGYSVAGRVLKVIHDDNTIVMLTSGDPLVTLALQQSDARSEPDPVITE